MSNQKHSSTPKTPAADSMKLANAAKLPVREEEMNKERLTIICVLGGPGCGKGTQSAHIVEMVNRLDEGHKAVHISVGEMMREFWILFNRRRWTNTDWVYNKSL